MLASRSLILAAAVAATLGLAVSGHAAVIWDGAPDGGGTSADNKWTTGTNWVGDTAPSFSSANVDITLPAGTTQKIQDLTPTSPTTRFDVTSITFAEGGFLLQNGTINPYGTGNGTDGYALARVDSTGDNEIASSFSNGTNSPAFISRSGTLTLSGSSMAFKSVTFGGDSNIVVTNAIAGGGVRQFNKTGAGTTTLNNGTNNDWTTLTQPQVSSGTLIVNGTAKLTTWNVRLGSQLMDSVTPVLGGNGTLGVSGTTTNVNVGGASAGKLSPGDPASANGVGTLSVKGNVKFGDLSSFLVDLGNAGSNDLLAITAGGSGSGNLDLSSLLDSLVINQLPGTTLSGNYIIATYSGTLTGTFDTVQNLPAGYTVDYGNVTPGAIVLVAATPTPEPASLGVLALGAMGLLARRRRA